MRNKVYPSSFKFKVQAIKQNPNEVVVNGTWDIVVMELPECEVVQTLVDYSNDPGKYDIAGFSYAPATGELVYGLVINPYKERKYQLIHFDTNSGKQMELAEGINPSWSPDGTQIAYLGLDGLYVVSADGQGNKQLVNQPFFTPWRAGSPWDPTPQPRWSPDGKFLIYHRCDNDEICMTKDAKIYKIPSEGGVEELIVSGKYSSWGDR